MKILVIIPCYNEALYLQKTLDSIINQSILPSQVIIVDDNSTDETPEIIKNYTSNYSWITGIHKVCKLTLLHVPAYDVLTNREDLVEVSIHDILDHQF